jgi:hypothetical protein
MPTPQQRRRTSEFNSGRTYERYAGEHTRGRVTAEGAAAGGVAAGAAAAGTSLSGAKLAGTPLGQSLLTTAEHKLRAQHAVTRNDTPKHAADQVARYKRYGQWAGKNRLKATGGILAAGGLAGGARIAQRMRANEEAGISQGIGRMKAGEHYERKSVRVGKSLVHTAAIASDLQAAGPRTKKAAEWALENRGKLTKYGLVGTGVVAGGTSIRIGQNHAREARRLRSELRQPVRKGGKAFLLAGALTGSAGVGTSYELHRKNKDDASRAALAGTVGGWAGQGAYQAAGYGPKHIVLNAERKAIERDKGKPQPKMVKGRPTPTPLMTTSRLNREQGRHAKLHGGKGSVEYYRNYPTHLPGGTANRVLGWSHRGRTGTALGAAATAGGTVAGTRMASGNGKGRKQSVHKALYQREERLSPLRVAQFGAGAGLAAWGFGRSRFLGAALAHGVRAARGKNNAQALQALQLAQAAQGALRRGTAPAEHSLRQIRRVNDAINRVPASLRPEVAATAGLLLAGHAGPLHTTSYRQVSTPVRYGW